jgi:beta-galactosidase GanA
MFYTKHLTLTDNTEQTLFTMPEGYTANIMYVFVANHGGSTNTIDLWWEYSATPQLYMFDGVSINSGSKEILGGQSSAPIFVLHNGEVVKTQASQATGNMEVAVTFELALRPTTLINFNGS